MTVVIGYIPNAYGEAALEAGIEEARRRDTGILVVNTSKGDSLVDANTSVRPAGPTSGSVSTASTSPTTRGRPWGRTSPTSCSTRPATSTPKRS